MSEAWLAEVMLQLCSSLAPAHGAVAGSWLSEAEGEGGGGRRLKYDSRGTFQLRTILRGECGRGPSPLAVSKGRLEMEREEIGSV